MRGLPGWLLVPLSDALLSLLLTCCSSCFPEASPLLSTLFLSQQNCKQLSFQLSLQINPAVVSQWRPTPPPTPLPAISFQKGRRPSKRSGKRPDCWVRAREKEPVVRSLPSFPAAGGGEDRPNETALLTSAAIPGGTDRGQETGHRASHSRAGTEGCSAELMMTDPHLLARGQVSGPPAARACFWDSCI